MKLVGEVEVPHARDSPLSRCLEGVEYKAEWPYSKAQLTPEDAGNDGAFYTIPKFVHHAGEECRSSLTDYYACVLPTTEGSAVLDLCSSWTSHYPESYSPKALGVRCAALGLNFLELLKNPHKTEFKIHDLNTGPKLPYGDRWGEASAASSKALHTRRRWPSSMHGPPTHATHQSPITNHHP